MANNPQNNQSQNTATQPQQNQDLLLFLDEIAEWCIKDLAAHAQGLSEDYVRAVYIEFVKQMYIAVYNDQKPRIYLMLDSNLEEVFAAIVQHILVNPAFGLEVISVPVVVYENFAVILKYEPSMLPREIIKSNARDLESTILTGATYINNLASKLQVNNSVLSL